MRFRRVALQLWAIFTLAWGIGVGVIACSGYAEVQLADAVRLEQHAKDLRLAGIDPATISWTVPAQINGFVVPPARLQMPNFWQVEAPGYAALGVSLPLGLLLAIEAVASVLAVARRPARQAEPAPTTRVQAKAIVFSGGAGSVMACSMAPALAASSASFPPR